MLGRCILLAFFIPLFCNAQELEPIADILPGEVVFEVPFKSGIFDVCDESGIAFVFRQTVNIESFIQKERLAYIRSITIQTENDFIGIEVANYDAHIRIVDGDSRTNATWISYIELISSKYHLRNGIYVGMKKEEFERLMNVSSTNEYLYFMLRGDVSLPAKYGYRIEGSKVDTLDTFMKINFRCDRISTIEMFVREGYFVP